ncbi:MAG: NnrS family protein, partial [Rhodomicrobium sp.]
GYLFVPLGFLLMALSIAFPAIVTPVAGIHAWAAGAIGIMTLAVMTRASLGHTGNALTASPTVLAIYIFAVIAALSRIAAAFGIEPQTMLVHIAAGAWILAFGGFAVVFGPLLLRPRSRG